MVFDPGFINGLGGLGAVIQGPLVGIFAELWGWNGVFYVLTILCVVAVLVLIPAIEQEVCTPTPSLLLSLTHPSILLHLPSSTSDFMFSVFLILSYLTSYTPLLFSSLSSPNSRKRSCLRSFLDHRYHHRHRPCPFLRLHVPEIWRYELDDANLHRYGPLFSDPQPAHEVVLFMLF